MSSGGSDAYRDAIAAGNGFDRAGSASKRASKSGIKSGIKSGSVRRGTHIQWLLPTARGNADSDSYPGRSRRLLIEPFVLS